MLMVQVSLDEAKERLSDLIDAASQGETVLIEKEGEQGAQVVQLVAVQKPARRRPKFGSAKGIILYMADDFDAPLEDFREYMD
jgi:antitoxin (DNA-binding transcriptional repressor) of toxin-antitoxin stability system